MTAIATRTDIGAMTPALSREAVELVKDTIARDQNLTDVEFRLFMYTAERHGLDPLARQIYAIRRKGKITFQTAIDGYRLCAARTGEYAGSDAAQFVEIADEAFPRVAMVTVYRFVQGQRCGFTGEARWDEYYPGEGADGFMWRKMPHGQLAKCAESQALRKAFPAELSGVYTDVEMQQAGTGEALSAGEALSGTEEPVTIARTDKQQAYFDKLNKSSVWTEDERKDNADKVNKFDAAQMKEFLDGYVAEFNRRKLTEKEAKATAGDAAE